MLILDRFFLNKLVEVQLNIQINPLLRNVVKWSDTL